MGNGRCGGAGYTCWSPRLLLLSPRHSDRHFPRCFSCRNYEQIRSVSFGKSSRFSGEGVLISQLGSVFFSNWLLFSGLDSWIGFENKRRNYEGIRPAPDTVMPIKDHLPSCLSWQGTKRSSSSSEKAPWNPSFQFTPPGKNPPYLQCSLEGDDTLLRLLRTPNLKKINKLWQ